MTAMDGAVVRIMADSVDALVGVLSVVMAL
jgi:hypothetical protein